MQHCVGNRFLCYSFASFHWCINRINFHDHDSQFKRNNTANFQWHSCIALQNPFSIIFNGNSLKITAKSIQLQHFMNGLNNISNINSIDSIVYAHDWRMLAMCACVAVGNRSRCAHGIVGSFIRFGFGFFFFIFILENMNLNSNQHSLP